MISVRYINQEKKRETYCNNCNKLMPIIFKYEFYDKENNKPYNTLHLCEDCSRHLCQYSSNAFRRLFIKSLYTEKNYKHDLDEITELGEE